MRILVRLHQAKSPLASPTSGVITLIPNWFEWLLGERARSGAVHRQRIDRAPCIGNPSFTWVWTTTERDVESAIIQAIEAAEIADLPVAQARET